MKKFDRCATSLEIKFTNEDGDLIVYTVEALPTPNDMEDSAARSENPTEEFVEYGEHTYRIELYVNIYEGNVAIFNDDTDEEIKEFEIKELYDE